MQPIDFRNENFESIRTRLSALRLLVHRAWLAHGPGTTRDVAAKAQIDILNFRPRTTELYQIGLVALVSVDHGHEAVYRARTLEEWETWCTEQRELATDCQLKLM